METSTPLPGPPPVAPAAAPIRPIGPRAGQLTPGWRLVTGAAWIMAFVAYTGAWKVSRELGLATWWLGPISEPQPFFVMLAPFAAPAVMVVLTLNNARRLPWYGLTASLVGVAVGLADLDHVRRLAGVELAIAAAGALVSVASLSGLYRSVAAAPAAPVEPTPGPEPQPAAP